MNENNKMNAMLDKSTDEFIDFDKLEAQLEDELEDQIHLEKRSKMLSGNNF